MQDHRCLCYTFVSRQLQARPTGMQAYMATVKLVNSIAFGISCHEEDGHGGQHAQLL